MTEQILFLIVKQLNKFFLFFFFYISFFHRFIDRLHLAHFCCGCVSGQTYVYSRDRQVNALSRSQFSWYIKILESSATNKGKKGLRHLKMFSFNPWHICEQSDWHHATWCTSFKWTNDKTERKDNKEVPANQRFHLTEILIRSGQKYSCI